MLSCSTPTKNNKYELNTDISMIRHLDGSGEGIASSNPSTGTFRQRAVNPSLPNSFPDSGINSPTDIQYFQECLRI